MSLPANPVNDRRAANAETLKSTFCPPKNQQYIQKYLIMDVAIVDTWLEYNL